MGWRSRLAQLLVILSSTQAGRLVIDTGYWILDTGYWVLGPRRFTILSGLWGQPSQSAKGCITDGIFAKNIDYPDPYVHT